MKRTIVGLTGLPASGKGNAAKHLQKLGFSYASLSDTLREVILSLGLTIDRKSMEDIGDVLRENLGSDCLARGAAQKIQKLNAEKIVIDGIRNPQEIIFLRKELGVFFIGITIGKKRLFEFIKKRGRPGDPKSFKEFEEMYDRELGVGEEETGLQLRKCIEQSDIRIENNGTPQDLSRKISDALKHLS